jgi:hypothetical protein
MFRTPIAIALLGLLVSPLAAEQDRLPSEKQIQFSSDISVPMLDAGGRPVVEVSINGSGPYRFILDTGASTTVIADDLIAELKLPSINGTPDQGPVRIDKLGLDALTISNATAIRGGPMLAGLSSMARGVLSAESFPGALISFDFVNKRITLRKGALPAADGRRVFEYGDDDPLPRVPVRIDGTELHLHIDTGAPTTMSLPLARAKTLGLEDKLVERGRARVVTGVFPVYEAPFAGKVEIGEFVVPLSAISFSDLRPGPAEPPGLIGVKFMQAFVVTIDARNRRVRFDKP